MGNVSQFALDGKVAIITGGSDGIGKGIAIGYARAGAKVVIASIPADRIAPAVEEVESAGGDVLGVACDVTDGAEVASMVDQVIDRFGRIDVLVNVAGGSYGPKYKRGPLLEIGESDFMGCLENNVKSGWLCCKHVVPIMLRQGGGCVINMASGAGFIVRRPADPMSVYSASKAAVINLTKSEAMEWAPTIRVNCIAPGYIASDRFLSTRDEETRSRIIGEVTVGRMGTPEDIANLAIYLASDAASYVNGVTFQINGGQIG